MAYKFESELRQRAKQYIQALARAGLVGLIVPDSLRDYTVKVRVGRPPQVFGVVNLYYSERRNAFSCKTHELKDKSEEALLLDCWDAQLPESKVDEPDKQPLSGWAAYVDGSHLNGPVGYGVVLLKDGEMIVEHSGTVEPAAVLDMRQIAGEMQAVLWTLEWCERNDVVEITIHHDYDGLEKWASGEFDAKNASTQAYVRRLRGTSVRVKWSKIKSHTGNRWNDRADELAKKGAEGVASASTSSGSELELAKSKAKSFVILLRANGILASYKGEVNGQFLRVATAGGNFDIYATRRRPISRPDVHGIQDRILAERLVALWQRHLSEIGSAADARPEARAAILGEAQHYYSLLKPYASANFDFVTLAQALARACAAVGCPAIDIENVRFDFRTLETIFMQLKREML